MRSRDLQFIGLISALHFFIAPVLKALITYPITITLTALFWPHVSRGVKEILAVACISSGVYYSITLGLIYRGFYSKYFFNLYLFAPFIMISIFVVFIIYFKILRSLFSKIGLDKRILDITGPGN